MMTLVRSRSPIDLGSAIWVVVMAATGLLACSAECKTPGNRWCEGKVLNSCVGGGENGNPYIIEEECSLKCVERGDFAACVVSEDPCPEDAVSICVGSILANCEDVGYPIQEVNCADHTATYCVEPEAGMTADCAYSDEPCEAVDTMCAPFEPAAWLQCSSGYWTDFFWCDQGTECFEQPDGGVSCE